MQKFDSSLSLYSFNLLGLLKGFLPSLALQIESSSAPSSPGAPYRILPDF